MISMVFSGRFLQDVSEEAGRVKRCKHTFAAITLEHVLDSEDDFNKKGGHRAEVFCSGSWLAYLLVTIFVKQWGAKGRLVCEF